MDIVGHAQLVRDRQQQGVRFCDGLIFPELFDQYVGFGRVAPPEDRPGAARVVVVNDDCIVELDSLSALVLARGGDRVGAVTGLIVFADRPRIVNAAGLVIDQLGVATERFVGLPIEVAQETVDVFGGSGAFTAYCREMIDDIGGFDESFFAYYEDADVAWRARMAGWRCLFTPCARARQ